MILFYSANEIKCKSDQQPAEKVWPNKATLVLPEGEDRAALCGFHWQGRGLNKFPFEKLTSTQSGDERRDRITRPVCLFRGLAMY